MNHAKKMILVPHDTVTRIRDTVTPTPQTQMSSLDTEMRTIMREKYADDSEKWKKYNEVLQRYLFFANESRKPIKLEIVSAEKPNSAMRQQLITVMPKTYKDQAVKMFDYLSSEGSPITWDSTGAVSIHGNLIPQSNILDFISDLTRSRRSFEPLGVAKFVNALAQMNFPLDIIGNERRRRAILQARQSGSGHASRRRRMGRVKNSRGTQHLLLRHDLGKPWYAS